MQLDCTTEDALAEDVTDIIADDEDDRVAPKYGGEAVHRSVLR